MIATTLILAETARIIDFRGLHTGTQFAANTGRRATLDAPLDVCAAAYLATTGDLPDVFFTDEVASIRLIECSAGAMAAIRAISAALDSEPCETQIAPGYSLPDYIEHVSNWAATAPIGEHFPPHTSEVIGRILRAAEKTRSDAPQTAA